MNWVALNFFAQKKFVVLLFFALGILANIYSLLFILDQNIGSFLREPFSRIFMLSLTLYLIFILAYYILKPSTMQYGSTRTDIEKAYIESQNRRRDIESLNEAESVNIINRVFGDQVNPKIRNALKMTVNTIRSNNSAIDREARELSIASNDWGHFLNLYPFKRLILSFFLVISLFSYLYSVIGRVLSLIFPSVGSSFSKPAVILFNNIEALF